MVLSRYFGAFEPVSLPTYIQHALINHYSRYTAERVIEEYRAALGGECPQNWRHWRRLMRRFGLRYRRVPMALLSSPMLLEGVLYLPRGRNNAQLCRWLAHEVAEACLIWEGTEPCVTPGVERHEVARLVELATVTALANPREQAIKERL